jgi:4a-hydroxytetrahydrobiopterin dehydratase
MSTLPTKCVPCEGGIPALTRERALELHAEVPRWTLDFPRLRRDYALKDFRRALAWVNRVGMLAEEQGHHPDLHITRWNHVELVLWTHAVNGLSENDFVMAKKIDELAASDGIA